MATEPIRTFAEFWPFYVRAHSRPNTRLMHGIGSILVVALLAGAIVLPNWWLVALAPIVGYGFAWYSHFFIEHNKPATFGHPFYSLAADYKMLYLALVGRMSAEVEKYCATRVDLPSSSLEAVE